MKHWDNLNDATLFQVYLWNNDSAEFDSYCQDKRGLEKLSLAQKENLRRNQFNNLSQSKEQINNELAIMGFIYLCIGSIIVIVKMFAEVIDK